MASDSDSSVLGSDAKIVSSNECASLPFTLADIQRIIDSQTSVFNENFSNIMTEISTVKTAMQNLSCDVADLKRRTLAIETSCEAVQGKQEELAATVDDLEEEFVELKKKVEADVDKLEEASRRDNLRFFNVPESPDESYESCADKIVNLLQNTVPNKTWTLDDVVRAHRLGSRGKNSVSNPRPMIVRMSRWKDKMAIISSGREALKKKGVKVAGDLTTRQRAAVKEHRDKGMHAYFKAGKLIVSGPLRTKENWSKPGQKEDETRANKENNQRAEQQHSSRVSGKGASSNLLNPGEWPAVDVSSRSFSPAKRRRPPSSPELTAEPEQPEKGWM